MQMTVECLRPAREQRTRLKADQDRMGAGSSRLRRLLQRRARHWWAAEMNGELGIRDVAEGEACNTSSIAWETSPAKPGKVDRPRRVDRQTTSRS